MIKKIAALAGAGALLLGAAVPVFANGWWWNNDDVDIDNHAYVRNTVITKADTGDNSIGGKLVFGGDINTGDAEALGIVTNAVNTTVVGDGD